MVNWCIELQGPLNQRGVLLRGLQAGCDRAVQFTTSPATSPPHHLTTSPPHHLTTSPIHPVQRRSITPPPSEMYNATRFSALVRRRRSSCCSDAKRVRWASSTS